MPSSPAERYPHPDCTSDEAPAGDVLSGSGPEVTAFIEENSCRRVLTQEVQSACGYPAARSGRTVETGELPVKALDATERAAGLPGKGITVNMRAARMPSASGRSASVRRRPRSTWAMAGLANAVLGRSTATGYS
jgi:hypothetical protein